MKLSLGLSIGLILLAGSLVQAQEQKLTGIVTTRYVEPGGKTIAFILTDPAKPTAMVSASGADAEQLIPRNHVMLSGSPGKSDLGDSLQVNSGSVMVDDTNQPFKSVPITATAFKDASAAAGNYVQLAGVSFAVDKFDSSGKAQVKADDGTIVDLLVGKGAAGRATPEGVVDIFGVVVKSDGVWKLVAARFLAANRKEMQELAVKSTCLSCHNPDTKVVGPTYRDVAAKYRNDPNATTELITQMQNGGSGKWGVVPMPALKATVQPDDMQKLADWIMSYKWDAILAE